MSWQHAILYVSQSLRTYLKDAFLPVWVLTGRETLNEMWINNGKFNTDIYAYGPLTKFSIRQLRGHGFIFISKKNEVIQTRDGPAPKDIEVTIPKTGADLKWLETQIGRGRVLLRKAFGDALRKIALRECVNLHGSEAETLMQADPHRHRVYGLPRPPPAIGIEVSRVQPYINDCKTDEKLVAMLDYYVYSADVVIYVGAGDLRTLKHFKKKDPQRYYRVQWHCIDPISEEMQDDNVHVHKIMMTSPNVLATFRPKHDNVEVALIWDVRSDRGVLGDAEWERRCETEDRFGEKVAWDNREWLSSALIKLRVPLRNGTLRATTSATFPQPGALDNLYELRNYMRLYGFSHVDRTHIPIARELDLPIITLRMLVTNFHGESRGKKLKRSLLEFLHITYLNGLDAADNFKRADMFYLTNKQNEGRLAAIADVVNESKLATLWVGDQAMDYDDFSYSARRAMLQFSTRKKLVLDGNGFMLFCMWKKSHIINDGAKYDPWWASQFAIIYETDKGFEPVPDVSLCRFIGLRQHSSQLRLRSSSAHEKADMIKRMGLDLSGHLYVCLYSNAYVTDLQWWYRMITEWSCLPKEAKKSTLNKAGAEVLEWKEDRADLPWHKREDLIAAMKLIREHAFSDIPREKLDEWIQNWTT
nr:VP4 [Sathuvachari virus]